MRGVGVVILHDQGGTGGQAKNDIILQGGLGVQTKSVFFSSLKRVAIFLSFLFFFQELLLAYEIPL